MCIFCFFSNIKKRENEYPKNILSPREVQYDKLYESPKLISEHTSEEETDTKDNDNNNNNNNKNNNNHNKLPKNNSKEHFITPLLQKQNTYSPHTTVTK